MMRITRLKNISDGRKMVQDDFSSAVLEALRKRMKAIKRKGVDVHLQPVKEVVDGRESDRGRLDVDLAYRVQSAKVRVRIKVWGDRWIWLDARRSSKAGWVWEYTVDGRLLPSYSASDLVKLAEQTIATAYLPDDSVARAIASVWTKCLARGPQPVYL